MSILTWIEDKKRLKLLAAPKNVIATGEPPQDSSKGLWTRCDKCGVILYIKHLKENQRVCFGCSYHLQMMSGERIASLLDRVPVHSSKKERFAAGPSSRESLSSTWRPLDETVSPCDPLNFHDQKGYTDRLKDAQERTGLQDAIQTGTGMIDGIPVALAVMDFSFMGGSMGSVVGEKITRLIEYATGEGLTLLIVSASGGARMQEGVFSLMQMAKISSALQIHQSCAKLLYISILTSPTTGGVTASFAMLGDIIFAEPKAVIAFAGRRVIEQTLCEDLPDDFQTSEYMLHHGLVDLIVPRRFLRQALSETIRLYQNAPFKKRGSIPFGVQNPITFLTEEKIRRKWGLLTKRGTKALISQNMTLSSDRSARRTAYREILSSFEIVLNLFVSGNTQKIGEPSSFVASGSPSSFTKGDPESNKSAKDTELYKPLQSSALYVQQRFPADKVVLHGFAARSKSSLFTRFVATFKNGFSISDTPKKSQASALILGRDHKSSICTSSCQSFSGLTNLCPSKNPAFKGQRSVHPNTKNGSIPISEPITKSKISSKESFASKAKLYTHRLYKKRVANLSLKIDGDAVNGSAVRSPRYKHKSPRLTNKAVFCKPLPPAIKSKVPFCKNVCKAMKSFVCLYKTEFCIPFRSKISIDQSKNKGLRLSSFPCIRLKQSFLREASLESCNAKLYKNFDFALNNFTSTNLGDLRKVTKDGFVSKADQIFDLPVGTGGYIGRSLNTKKSTFEQRLVKSVVGKASLCRKAKSNPKVGARDEVSPSYLLHRFRAFSESLYTSNTDLVTKQGFSSRISRSAIGLAPADLQHKNKIYNQNKLQKKQKQSSYKSKICSGRPNQSNKSSYVANKIFFAEGAFKRDAQLCKPETLLKSMQNESQKDSTSKFAIRKREKELTIDSTGRANDINFLNQAIELAATESVEWRAFYIHQQLSENMGFFEDFLQENPNLSKKRENMLFYKSICRSKKTLQVQPSVDKK